MHDRQTEILCTLERIERLLMRLCNNTSKDGFYYVPVTGTVKPGTSDYQVLPATKKRSIYKGKTSKMPDAI